MTTKINTKEFARLLLIQRRCNCEARAGICEGDKKKVAEARQKWEECQKLIDKMIKS